LDHENGDVSRGVKFSKVRVIYKELFESFMSKLSEEDSLLKRLKGNTKYNKSYYLEATEVFARSLEIYLVKVLKIDNSLVKINDGFAYPDDEKLINEIKLYFDEFFGACPAAMAVGAY